MPDQNGNLLVGDVDFTADPFVIPVGDFAGQALPFNDPLLPLQSFITGFDIQSPSFALVPTLHINILPVWQEYSGAGVSIASVEGYQYQHPDLLNQTLDSPNETNVHGTAVAGIIASEANNGIGSAGIAYGATFGHFHSYAQNEFDIWQSSEGHGSAPYVEAGSYWVPLASSGRLQLGTIYVNAAGNGGHVDTSTETSPLTSTFEVIPVAQGNAIINESSGRTFGAAIHITGLTGVGYSSNSVFTTDIAGDDGYISAESAVGRFFQISQRGFDLADLGLAAGNYTNFSGTSAAAPIVSGSVALVLEASGNNIWGGDAGWDLGWRDVQEILAISARHIGSALGAGYDELKTPEHHPWQINGASNINGGGYHFAPDYGFGYIDVHGAVRLAETWNLTRTSHNLETQSNTLVADDSPLTFSYGNAITLEFEVTGDSLDLDVVELLLSLTHEAYREVQITITSPDGTTSNLFDTPGLDNSDETIAAWIEQYGEDAFGGTLDERTILSRAFWGEETVGTWIITIEDMVDNGNEGTIDALDLVFKGDAATDDDTYYFTLDWALMNEANGGVALLVDSAGTNAINTAVVMDDVNISLVAGSTSSFGGAAAFSLAEDAVFTLAIAGDGNDTLTGADLAEQLFGMRGNDKLFGGSGDDALVGGTGADTLRGDTGDDVSSGGAGNDQLFAGGTDEGDDIAIGGAGNDVLGGAAGNDLLVGGGYNDGDTLQLALVDEGDSSTDDGSDLLYGGSGNDTLIGGGWDDSAANDNGIYDTGEAITSGLGADELWAGTGDDLVIAAAGNDTIGGGVGDDTVEAGGGDDIIYGGKDAGDTGLNDSLMGGAGNDIVFGGAGNDFVAGGGDNDELFGGGGNDTIEGGSGSDTIFGGAGDDTITGGEGADRFSFAANQGDDVITDFEVGEDTLVLANAATDFTSLADVEAAATEVSGGLLIDLGDGNSLLLEGISTGDLQADDFVF